MLKTTLKLLLPLKLILLLAVPAKASADSVASKVWNDFQSNSQLHFLDNLTPGMFYDFKQHEMMTGGTTEIYSYRKIGVDFGIVRSIERQSDAIPTIGAKFKLGSWLDSIPSLHVLSAVAGLDQGMLQYLTVGGWSAREFNANQWRYGLYGGFLVLFGGSGSN